MTFEHLLHHGVLDILKQKKIVNHPDPRGLPMPGEGPRGLPSRSCSSCGWQVRIGAPPGRMETESTHPIVRQKVGFLLVSRALATKPWRFQLTAVLMVRVRPAMFFVGLLVVDAGAAAA